MFPFLIPIGMAGYHGYKSVQAFSNGNSREGAVHAVGVVTSGMGGMIAVAGQVPRAVTAIRMVTTQAPGVVNWMAPRNPGQ